MHLDSSADDLFQKVPVDGLPLLVWLLAASDSAKDALIAAANWSSSSASMMPPSADETPSPPPPPPEPPLPLLRSPEGSADFGLLGDGGPPLKSVWFYDMITNTN